MNNNLEEKMKVLKAGYLNKLKDKYPSLKELSEAETLNIQEIYNNIHTISGTSGMYGLQELSELATNFEIFLKPIKDNEMEINTEELKIKFSDFLKAMESILTKGA